MAQENDSQILVEPQNDLSIKKKRVGRPKKKKSDQEENTSPVEVAEPVNKEKQIATKGRRKTSVTQKETTSSAESMTLPQENKEKNTKSAEAPSKPSRRTKKTQTTEPVESVSLIVNPEPVQAVAIPKPEKAKLEKVKPEEQKQSPVIYEDDSSPIHILPAIQPKLAYSASRQNKYQRYNKNFQNRRPAENLSQDPAQLNRNNRKNKQFKPKFSQHTPPAFDNSSVIAAISGKIIQGDIYEPSLYDTVQPHVPGQPLPQGLKRDQNSVINADFEKAPYIPQPQVNNEENNRRRPQEYKPRNDKRSSNSNYTQAEYPSRISSRNYPKPDNISINQYGEQDALPPLPEIALPESDLTSIKKTRRQPATRRNKRDTGYDISHDTQMSHESFNPHKDFEEKSMRGILKMFVSVQPEEQVEVVITEDGLVTEYFVEMTHQAKIRGNIYKGVIHNVDPNLQAAFVNFGAEKNGFLQIDEVHPEYYLNPHISNKSHKYPLINKVLRPGQEILVQIVKEPNGSKGAFLTTWISLAGRFLVLTPGQEQLGVSRKVLDPEERSRLRSLLDGIDPGEDMGVIIRTAAATASQEEISADLDYLQRLWIDIVKRANNALPSELIHQEVELTQRVVRDYLNADIREIWTDDKIMAESIHEMSSLLYPKKRNLVKLHQDPRQTLWERFNLQKQLNEVTSREIHLSSGGRVTFDQTEALMAIDINSGKTQNKANFNAMVLQTNLEAAEAIARHLRLRDIGGQIVVDFIELRDKNQIKEVERTFKEAMKPDRARYDFGHISPFGLLEIVRQRIGTSAISISSEPCPHCHGTGQRRNMEWQAQDALKEIARKARQEKTTKYVYSTNTELALYLLNTKRDRIAELEEKLGLRIEIIC